MQFPQKNTPLKVKSERIKQYQNSAAEESQIPMSLPWKESILQQIDKTGPIIAKFLADDLIPVIEKIGKKVAEHQNYLSELEAIQEAYENQWILSTSQVSNLLNIDSRIILKYQKFEQHGFIFFRYEKMLYEVGWMIDKSLSGHDDDY